MPPEQNKAPPAVSLAALFFGFSKIGLSGFGGVLPFARHYLVDTSRWMTAEEFNQQLGLCQFLAACALCMIHDLHGKIPFHVFFCPCSYITLNAIYSKEYFVDFQLYLRENTIGNP